MINNYLITLQYKSFHKQQR